MRSTITYLCTALLALSAAAQTTPEASERTAEPAAAVTKKRDDFEKVTWYRGREVPGHKYDTVFLRAYKYDRERTRYQIYVSDHYESSWRFYDTAHDSSGKRLRLTEISREVGSCDSRFCSHYEDLAIDVSREYLQANSKTGISFQLSGRGGKQAFTIPSEHIAEFLAAVPR